LLSVIAISKLLAIFLQTLSLRLGIAPGRDLAQLCRDQFSQPVVR
jgi:manganese transport protein